RRVVEPARELGAAGRADDSRQCDLHHTAMRHHEDVAVLMSPQDLVERGADPRVEGRGALAARHYIPIRLLDPGRPRLWKSLGDLFGAQTLPFAEVDLAQRACGSALQT